jgi:16S rRNA G966 N2-methylase RsmD
LVGYFCGSGALGAGAVSVAAGWSVIIDLPVRVPDM